MKPAESWKLIYSRGMSIQRAIDFSLSIGPGFKKTFGFGLMNHKLVRYKDNLEGYCLEGEFETFVKRLKDTLSDKSFHKKFMKELEWGLQAVQELPRITNCPKDSNNEVVKKLLRVKGIKTRLFLVPWYTFVIDQPLNEKLSEIANRHAGLDKEAFIRLTRLTTILSEESELLRIARNPGKKKIEAHTRKYSFIPMYDVDYSEYDYSYFKSRLDSINEPAAKIKRIVSDIKKNKEAFEKELKKTRGEDRDILKFINFIVWLREDKIALRNREAKALKPLYAEIAKRLGVSITEAINLTYDELISGLKGNPLDQAIIDRRKSYFELIIHDDKVRINDAPNQAIQDSIRETDILKGQTAMPGSAKGKAKIVLNAKELYKIEEGDVLVTPMTKPDFITAIRKSSAIVTDEGGITCHAAIIARELKKPCIIGTKIATKVLKNGDLVEVDADKGIVRKI